MGIKKPRRVDSSPLASAPEGVAVNFHTNLEMEIVVEIVAMEGVTSQTITTATMEVETVALEGVTSQTTTTTTMEVETMDLEGVTSQTTATTIGKVSSLKVMEREAHAHSLHKAGARKATIASFRTILVEAQALNNPTTGMAMALEEGDDDILQIRCVNQDERSHHLKSTVQLQSKISQTNYVVTIDLSPKVGLQLLTMLPLLVKFYLPLRSVS